MPLLHPPHWLPLNHQIALGHLVLVISTYYHLPPHLATLADGLLHRIKIIPLTGSCQSAPHPSSLWLRHPPQPSLCAPILFPSALTWVFSSPKSWWQHTDRLWCILTSTWWCRLVAALTYQHPHSWCFLVHEIGTLWFESDIITAAIKLPIQRLHCLFLTVFFSESFHSGFGSHADGLHSCLGFFLPLLQDKPKQL